MNNQEIMEHFTQQLTNMDSALFEFFNNFFEEYIL